MKASRWAYALALACATLLLLSSVALGSAPGDLLWARTATGHSIYYAVAAARDGGVYAVGESHGKPNTAKVLVVRRAANGSTRWSRTYGAGNALAVAVDGSGSAYLAASVTSRAGKPGYALLKISPSGRLLWSRSAFGKDGRGLMGRPCLAVSPSGTAFLAAREARGLHVIVRKYTPKGTLKWTWRNARAARTSLVQAALGLDAAGRAYVADIETDGSLATSSIDASGHLLWHKLEVPPSPKALGFTAIAVRGERVCAAGSAGLMFTTPYLTAVATYDLSGSPIYATAFSDGVHTSSRVNAVALDAEGHAYLTGSTGALTFPPESGGCLTVKLDPTGAVAWTRVYGSDARTDGVAVALDTSGSAYVVGTTLVGLKQAMFALSYDASGGVHWEREWRDSHNGDDEARALAVAGSGGVYVGGDYLKGDYYAALVKFQP